MHWTNIGGSTSAQYPTDLIGGVTTTAASSAFLAPQKLAGKVCRLLGYSLGASDGSAITTIAIKDHAATATYYTITVPAAGAGAGRVHTFPRPINIPIGGLQSVCSDTDITATLFFEVGEAP